MACTVSNCCFCVDLRTGSFMIGYGSLVWGIISSIIFVVTLSASTWWAPSIVVVILALNLSLSVIRVIFTCVLLIGIHQYDRPYVKAFLIYGAVYTVLTIALFITSMVLYPIVLDVIINIIDLVLIVYFLLVIRSYYLSDSSKAPQYPVVGPHFVVQQPQFVLQQQPQFVITQRPQYVMPQPPQYVVQQTPQYVMSQQQNVMPQQQNVMLQHQNVMPQQQNVMPQQQNVVQQEPPPMYNKFDQTSSVIFCVLILGLLIGNIIIIFEASILDIVVNGVDKLLNKSA